MIMEEVILVDEGSYSPDGSIEIKQEVTMESTVIMNDDPFAELESVKQEKPEEEQPQESEEGKRGAFNTRKKGYINYADTCNLYDSVIASLQDHNKKRKKSSGNLKMCKSPGCCTRVSSLDPHGTCRKHRGICLGDCEACQYLESHPSIKLRLMRLDRRHEAFLKRKAQHSKQKHTLRHNPISRPKQVKKVVSKAARAHPADVLHESEKDFSDNTMNGPKDIICNNSTAEATASLNQEEIVQQVLKSLQSNIIGMFKDILPSLTSQLSPSVKNLNYSQLPSSKFKFPDKKNSLLNEYTFDSSTYVDVDLSDTSSRTSLTAKFATYHKEFNQYYPSFFTIEPTKKHVVALPSMTKKAVPVLSLSTDILDATWLGKPPTSLASSKGEVWSSSVSFPTKNQDPCGDRFVTALPYNRFVNQNFEDFISAPPLKQIELDPLLADKTSISTGDPDWPYADYLARVSVKDASVSDRYLQLAERILDDFRSDRFRDSNESVSLLHNAIRLARVANSKSIAGISAVAANARFMIRSKVLECFDSPQPRVAHSLLRGQFGHADPLGPMHNMLTEEAQRDKHVCLKLKGSAKNTRSSSRGNCYQESQFSSSSSD